jgi:hypothetical protein
MAGLIEQQLMGAGPSPGSDPRMQQDAQMEAPADPTMGMEEDGGDFDDSDPAFQQALKYAMGALYENGAAEQVAQGLMSAPERVEGLANTTYEVISVVDERTNGEVPDELLVLLASKILEEVIDIGDAAGAGYKPTEIAEAFKMMILRFVQENGGDITELQAAMDQVDPAVFDEAAMAED